MVNIQKLAVYCEARLSYISQKLLIYSFQHMLPIFSLLYTLPHGLTQSTLWRPKQFKRLRLFCHTWRMNYSADTWHNRNLVNWFSVNEVTESLFFFIDLSTRWAVDEAKRREIDQINARFDIDPFYRSLFCYGKCWAGEAKWDEGPQVMNAEFIRSKPNKIVYDLRRIHGILTDLISSLNSFIIYAVKWLLFSLNCSHSIY